MKQIVSYILLTIYTLIIISPAMPMVDYVVNYKHISEDLCVNKDKPEMHCNGKCHLKKEIKKVLGDDNPNKKKTTIPTLKLKEYTYYYHISLLKKYYLIYQFADKQNDFLTPKIFKGFLTSLIKPPPVFLSYCATINSVAKQFCL